MRATLGQHPSTLSLGAFASAGTTLLPSALAEFRRAHPHVRLALSDVEPPDGYGLAPPATSTCSSPTAIPGPSCRPPPASAGNAS